LTKIEIYSLFVSAELAYKLLAESTAGWFGVREKYCWLANKPSQIQTVRLIGSSSILEKKSTDSNIQTRPDPSPGKRAQAGAWPAAAYTYPWIKKSGVQCSNRNKRFCS